MQPRSPLVLTVEMILALLVPGGLPGDSIAKPAARRAVKERPRLVAQLGHSGAVTAVAFSPDGKRVLTGSADNTARMWDAATGHELRAFRGNARGYSQNITSVAFSPDGKRVLTGSYDKTARLWDAATGQQLRAFRGHSSYVTSVAFSPDGKRVLTGSGDNFGSKGKTARLWDAATGHLLRAFRGHASSIDSVAFSPDGKRVLTGSHDRTARLWDAATGHLLRAFRGHAGAVTSVAFSPDGKLVLTGGGEGTLWDAATGQELRAFRGHASFVSSVAFSPDGKQVLTGSNDKTARLWDAATGQQLRESPRSSEAAYPVAFSSDGKRVLLGILVENTVRLWDAPTGQELRAFRGHAKDVTSRAKVYPPKVTRERAFRGHTSNVTSVAFSPDGKRVLTGSEDSTARLWDAASGRELCRLISFSDGTWAVVDPQGRFDASNGGDVAGLHWVVGNEAIALNQLKERYYDPGLLAKKLGFNREPLRPVRAFTHPRLYPAVRLTAPTAARPRLGIALTNRGGGIGRVVVKVNGKELTADARGQSPDPDARALHLDVDLAGDPRLKPGEKNVIEVQAFNAEGYLRSRGLVVVWVSERRAPVVQPELYAIVGGISTYASPDLALHFAAKDAEDMARALEVGAKRLFGADKVHLTLLASSKSARAISPTKDNFRKAFAQARQAKPGDVLVVYLAGHGLALRKEADVYCYLTREARSLDSTVLADPVVRGQTTITSDELVRWVNAIPALKQVMVLDTCAAGAAAVRLTEKRAVSGDQVRAIERLKDRTGFHVLMGCAADRVSYEASRYGQGLLTYALLRGMKGAALRDGEYVDVSKLFQYAADQVPELARDIGGIQKPRIAAPRGTSFDVGRLPRKDREAIPLALVKPLLLRPLLLNPEEGDDNLGLMPLLGKRLAEDSSPLVRGRARPPAAVYLDADDFPGAIRPSGTYTVAGRTVRVKLVLRRRGKTVDRLTVLGSSQDLPALAAKLADAIGWALRKLTP